MMLDKARVVREGALVRILCCRLRVELSDDTRHIKHLFYFLDLRGHVASHLPLRDLELLLYLMLDPVMHIQLILPLSLIDIICQLLAEVRLHGRLVVCHFLLHICQQLVPVLVMQGYLILHGMLGLQRGARDASLVDVDDSLRHHDIIVVIV